MPLSDVVARRLPRLLPNSLQLAVLLVVLVGLAVPAGVAFWLESRASLERAEHQLQRDLLRNTDVLAASLRAPLWELSRAHAESIVRAMIEDERFVAIVVREAGSERPFVELRRLAGDAQGILVREQSIFQDGVAIGSVHVSMTLEPYLKAVHLTMQREFVILLAVAAIALLLIFFLLRRRLLLPIARLTAAAHSLADEQLATPVVAERDDELGSVAASLEYMRRRLLDTFGELQQRNDELTQHANLLETRVAERTEALSLSNSELQQTLASLRATQASLIEAEKLAALGRLVAGVAHELNTPLGNAMMVVTALEEPVDKLVAMGEGAPSRRADLKECVAQVNQGHALIYRNVHRAATIVQDFKQLAVEQRSEVRASFDLATVVEETLQRLRPSFRDAPCRLERELEQGIGMDGYPEALAQVVSHVVLNALIHAFAGRDDGVVKISCARSGSAEALLVCRDDGIGMSDEVRQRIFDPFFTTTFGQGGSGLGLHLVHNFVVGLLGGSIEVESQPGKGSAFVIRLPLQAPVRKAASA